MSDELVLPRAVREEILRHALEEAPKECCGVLVGHDGVAERAVRCRNAHREPNVRYEIDPRDLYAVLRPMEDEDRELVAIYHSHPASPPVPSPTDRAEARWPRALHVLASWRTGAPELRAYRIEGDWMREVPVRES
ncbi:MAG TPA: M67 family metallopeptidase [Candidatus Limnocylindria bacterium]|nr:M67 family metallopeptidase [Candidatus Limnocylindria bacterium]